MAVGFSGSNGGILDGRKISERDIANRPLEVSYFVNNICNLRCKHCYAGYEEKDELMNEIIRGIVNGEGDVYFYVGYDFDINNEIESIFFDYLKELVKQLRLRPTAKIFGG